MTFIVYGINHKTAPLSVREKLAQAFLTYQDHPASLLSIPHIQEAMILSTCNRTEFYLYAHQDTDFLNYILKKHFNEEHNLASHFYRYEQIDAIRHILHVAIGIDSMMIGEPQILGQLKQAFLSAKEQKAIKKKMRDLFSFIFKTSKSIRAQSGIGNNPVSVASAATRLIQTFFNDLSPLHFFIIGAGETATLVSKYLIQQKASSFTVSSRTFEHAERLSTKLQGTSVHLYDIPHVIHKADVLITATACPLPFIHKEMIKKALEKRNQKPMLLMDLSIPRDIEPNVQTLPNIHLINIDDLHRSIEESLEKRTKSAQKASLLIDYALKDYLKTLRSSRANPVISDYRAYIQSIAALELNRATQKLSNGHCQFTVLNEFSQRLINKLSHLPTLVLREAAITEQEELLQFAQTLFQTPPEKFSHEEIN